MFKKIILTTALLALSSQVSASLVLDVYESGDETPNTPYDYTMTGISYTGIAGTTSGFDLLASDGLDGSLSFVKNDGTSAAVMTHGNVSDYASWINGESFDYDIYTTDILHWVEIILPENTFAFSFNLGTSYTSAGGWIEANGADGTKLHHDFASGEFGSGISPGYGVYSTGGNCEAITSVIIEPQYWGFGNLSISQGNCATVPEPSLFFLVTAGFIGLMGSTIARRKRKLF